MGRQGQGRAGGPAEIIVCGATSHGRTTTIIGLSTEAQYRDGFGPFAPGFAAFRSATRRRSRRRSRRNRRVPRRADSRRGRHHRSARGLSRACARNLHAPQRPADLRRSADRPRPHRQMLACQHEGVRPDGVILGKALGGGLLPVSHSSPAASDGACSSRAITAAPSAAMRWPRRSALKALDVLIEERLCRACRAWGDELLASCARSSSPLIREVRGKGLLIGVESIPRARARARRASAARARRAQQGHAWHRRTLRAAARRRARAVDLAVGALNRDSFRVLRCRGRVPAALRVSAARTARRPRRRRRSRASD